MATTTLVKKTYVDSAAQLATKARTELLKGAGKDWTEAKAKATEAGKLELQSLNLLRSAGVKLRDACDHEKLSFTSFRLMQDSLPKDLTFPAAKFCVSLGNQFDAPIKSLDDARAARRILFEKLSEEAPRRIAQQTAHDTNPWSELVNKFASVTAFFGQMMEDEPMEDWDKEKLRKFVKESEPIVAAHKAAEALMEALAK
jgi:hypothetical protein